MSVARRQRRAPDTGTAPGLAPGLYARLDGVDYRLESRGGRWALWTGRQTPGFTPTGFTKGGTRRFFRTIAPDERLECFRVASHGTYRGLTVEIMTSSPATIMAVSRDPRSQDDGFTSVDRDQWGRLLSRDDPHLHVTTTRTTVPAPWRAART